MPKSNLILSFNPNELHYEIEGQPAKLAVKGNTYEFHVAFDYPLEVFIKIGDRTLALTTGYGNPIIQTIHIMERSGDGMHAVATLGQLEIPADHECIQFISF
jgi:hypothetical protein